MVGIVVISLDLSYVKYKEEKRQYTKSEHLLENDYIELSQCCQLCQSKRVNWWYLLRLFVHSIPYLDEV